MADSDESVELLFFDTFSHDINEDLNLDLVQFPQPVCINEVRIIPLGARVQADFPGGVRLGATNPSKFHIELFVNDLAKPGVSTFERFGNFEYNQNDCINFVNSSTDCNNVPTRQIPTDGLVLRGCYTTITLAVYGALAKDEITEQQISSPTPPIVPIDDTANVPIADEKNETNCSTGDFNNAIADRETKDNGNSFFPKDAIPDVPAIVTNVSVSESARQYTEEWIASTGTELANSAVAVPMDAKSPDIDNWDADDDLNKSPTILSPKTRRSRSPESRRLKRDWSKSPDYRRHRSYERGVLDKKLSKTREYDSLRRSPPNRAPRTPSSEDIQSLTDSRRPHTPESHISDDFNKYVKSVQSPQSIAEEADIGNAMTAVSSLAPTEPDEDAMSQDEQFEPILSDDEIPDDAVDQYEMDYETENDLTPIDSALKHFNPFTEEVKCYIPIDEKMSANARELIELATKCLHRSKLKESVNIEKIFAESQSNELRENWVHAAEQLIQIINLIYNLAGATQSRSQQALNNLIKLNRRQLIDWMRIGLNFNCANSQQQPGYKIRHLKCGLRLIELLAVDEVFIECLIYKEQFNLFEYLYCLYEQKFMALSLKLMICRAIFACLDTKVGIEFFTQLNHEESVKPNLSGNGYQKLVKLLQENPLTRLKFALRSILKKVNLYESLLAIRDIVSRRFMQRDDVKMELPFQRNDATSEEKLLSSCLREVWSAFTWDAQSYWQPKRFLPISTKFEKVSDSSASRLASTAFVRHFHMTGLLESLLMIVSQSSNTGLVSDEVFDLTLLLLESLCRAESGLNYMSEKADVTNVLIKCLIQAPVEVNNQSSLIEDVEMTGIDSLGNTTTEDPADIDEDSRRYHLGIEIAYKIKTKFCLDAIIDIPSNCEDREERLIECFHTLFSLAVADNQIGRNHVIETITMNSNIITILKQIENEKKNWKAAPALAPTTTTNDTSANDSDGLATKRSPILNYAIDLIDLTVRYATTNLEYLKHHGSVLLNLVKSHDQFDDMAISQTLQETAIFLKPLQIPNVFSYDNIGPLCEVIKRNLEFITTFPGDLIMALKIIRHLATPDTLTYNVDSDFADTFGDASATNKFKLPQEQHQVELKYKFVMIQFYSAEGCATCVHMLDKLTSYFAQPAVHVAALGSMQGQLLTQTLLPTIQILRKMLTYVIDCRNTEFKDLTAIEPLLKTYTLVSYVPAQSINANDARKIQNEIIATLMAYTQPTPTEGVDTETVHKSLWTQMLGELCKYIMSGPYTILPGLTILSQLLPVPLPVLTRNVLSVTEQNRLVTERQLWSAHLHPQSIEIAEMIQALCVSSYAPLLDTLSRIVGQLSDLAPNMALLVTKSVTDLLLNDGSSSINPLNVQNGSGSSTPQAANAATPATTNTMNSTQSQTQMVLSYVNPFTKRVVAFLSNILCFAPIKSAFILNMQGKINDQLLKILAVKANVVPANLLLTLNQEQELVLMIFHSILNADISLIGQYEFGVQTKPLAADVTFGGSIPPKDCLVAIIASILDWFLNADENLNATGCHLPLKTMTLLSNYDYTAYQLKVLLDKRKDQILAKLRTLTQLTEDDQIASEITLGFLLFLLSLVNQSECVKSERQYIWTESDLARILQFKRSSTETDLISEQNTHPLLMLEQNLQNSHLKEDLLPEVKIQLDELAFTLKKLLKILDSGAGSMVNANKETYHADSPASEPPFPQAESIVSQYSMRTIYNVTPIDFKVNDYPEQLTTNYWYTHFQSFNRFDDLIDAQPLADNVSCDFVEMMKVCLPSETNLTNDCKRLLHLSASPQSNRERTTSAPCFRTRRVEVEPTTGRPEKKLYISRGRGFPRSVQSRADLFRSRPPNTSRPPSLHVDDFLALETCGAQPTGPTGYNKLAREIISIRGSRGRGRGRILTSTGIGTYRHNSLRRPNAPSSWANHNSNNTQHDGSSQQSSPHFRTATAEPVISHFQPDYFSNSRGSRRGSLRPPRSFNKFN